MKIKANDYKANEVVKIIREWSELTQKEFGKTINRSERSIQSLESGDRHCTVDTLLQIAKTHNINIIFTKDSSNK